MNDPTPFDGPGSHLSDRMRRAVDGLHAPDVLHGAMARGRRQRTRRRLAYTTGGVAAATVLALTLPALADGGPGRGPGPSSPSVAADPTTRSTSASPATTAPGDDAPDGGACGPAATGWWSKTPAQIQTELSALLPAGVRAARVETGPTGLWEGDFVTGDDADFASLTLLPPPGIPGPINTLAELSQIQAEPCVGGKNKPEQAVTPCAGLAGTTTCEELRSEDGALVGLVTEKTEIEIVDGQQVPTDQTFVVATIAGPGGGHVELYVAEGTRIDRPGTVSDPAGAPALTPQQARAIVADPFWTS